MSDNVETFDISVHPKGAEPEVHKNLRAAAIVAIPKDRPENNTTLLLAGLTPETVAEVGAYLIRVARALKEGRAPDPFGASHPNRSAAIIQSPDDPFKGLPKN